MEKSVSSTEKQDNEVLNDICKAVKSVVKQYPLKNTDVLTESLASVHRLALDRQALKSRVLRLLKSNTGRKYTNPEDAMSYLEQMNPYNALDLLGKIAEECQGQLKQNSAK